MHAGAAPKAAAAMLTAYYEPHQPRRKGGNFDAEERADQTGNTIQFTLPETCLACIEQLTGQLVCMQVCTSVDYLWRY